MSGSIKNFYFTDGSSNSLTDLSSNHEMSNDEDEDVQIQQASSTTIIRSSYQIHKRARISNEHGSIQDQQSHTIQTSTSSFNQIDLSSTILSNDNETNNINVENSLEGNNNSIFIIPNENSQGLDINNQETSGSTTPITDLDSNLVNNSTTRLVQTSLEEYFPLPDNPFEQINNLNEATLNFRIRCKVIYKSSIRAFGTNNKVFDAIVCDLSGEIKLAGFNEEVDRLYDIIINNQTITIENGNVQLANEKFRSPYSLYEIRLLSTSIIQTYNCTAFKPMMMITKQTLHQINQTLHGTHVDAEGIVVMDRGTTTSTSQSTGEVFRRRSLKIKDDSGLIFITLWNKKIDEIPEHVINKKIRIRNGKTNNYNDYVTINISEQTIMEYY